VAGYCEYVNEPAASLTGGEFLDRLMGYQVLKDSAPSN
jgi:hypothetical protein